MLLRLFWKVIHRKHLSKPRTWNKWSTTLPCKIVFSINETKNCAKSEGQVSTKCKGLHVQTLALVGK